MSPGHEKADLTCTSCHDMHGGDPRGMIQPVMRGNQACLQCHARIGLDVAAHTHHLAGGTGSDCYGCHMPPMTYGLVAIHPNHRITNPEPANAWRHDMPEACTLCHTNQTALWAAARLSVQYGRPMPTDPPSGRTYALAEDVRALLGGDVVQRVVAANALTQERSYTPDERARLWAVPFLLLTMDDHYPAVRHFAYRGLLALCARAARTEPAVGTCTRLPAFDYLAGPPARAAVLEAWWAWWRALDKRHIPHPGEAVPLDADLLPLRSQVAGLTALQDTHLISIGE
jgi:predicted CXXCH cytochrome family protein